MREFSAIAISAIDEGDALPPDDRISDQPSMADTYRAQRPRLLRFFHRSVSPDQAQDLLQQAFTRLLGRSRGSAVGSPEAYLQRTGQNLLHDEHRRAQRRPAHLSLDDGCAHLHAPDQVAVLEARDVLRRLEIAISRLKPKTREIFLAHRFDGYTYGEIAARTGLSVKAVEKQMSKAIAYIDRTIGEP